METKKRSKKLPIFVAAFAAVLIVVGAMGCAPKANPGNPTPDAQSPSVIPEKNSLGLIGTEGWKDQYPNQYKSYYENDKNAWPGDNVSKVALAPETVTLGKGYGYAKFYYEPGGHTSTIYSVTHNGRVNENTKAQCLACKTPDIHALVAQQGDSAWKLNMTEVVDNTLEDGLSCSMCHENENPTKLAITRVDWKRALGESADKRPLSSEACGQCHCDYSMNAETGEPTSPYDDVMEMDPVMALKWYDEHNVADWTYPDTGAKMVAVRHSEFEYTNGAHPNHMVELGYTCADCHMPVQTDDKGAAYHSHYWQSPLDNQELIDNDCSKCHKDIKAEMESRQEQVSTRTHEIGMRAASFVQNFVAAVQAGNLSEDELAQLRTIQREASALWNSCAAENSRGAHNQALFNRVLDEAEMRLDEGDKILGVESSADKFVSEYDPAKEYQWTETADEFYASHPGLR